jgi:hypothetical protein
MKWVRHLASINEKDEKYIHLFFFVGKPERKRPLGRIRYIWKDNAKMVLEETRQEGVNWIHLA